MLVLTRKVGEAVMVGDVPVTVVEISGDKVRLGIEAPEDVPVHREEVYRTIWGDVTPEIVS
jgi:carbon storage regulator